MTSPRAGASVAGDAPPYGAETYGDRIAEIYDDLYEFPAQTAAAVDLLVELAGPGPALELGIGTGRLALPLSARGVKVIGIDASDAMVAKLRAKPGGADIDVVIGDFSTVPGDVPCPLVYVAFNTLFALLSQEAQLRCFERVAARLVPGGRFLVEAFVPDLARFDRGQRTSNSHVLTDRVVLEVSAHHQASQRVDSAHVVIGESGTKIFPVQIRYCWPSELDLMARLAGLTLEERWGDWRRSPFTDDSAGHVSVWRAP
jgi:ubiquinone/menaquinone biosynthesis C-methylase UbiE